MQKKRGDETYSGSVVKQGETAGVFIATGGNTFFGRTAKLVAGAGAVSHAQKAMFQIGNFLIIVAVVLALVLVIAEVVTNTKGQVPGPDGTAAVVAKGCRAGHQHIGRGVRRGGRTGGGHCSSSSSWGMVGLVLLYSVIWVFITGAVRIISDRLLDHRTSLQRHNAALVSSDLRPLPH